MDLTGYHGTDSANVASICVNNFNTSRHEMEWLGFGIYFFIEGISSPVDAAENWAMSAALDAKTQLYTYTHFSVLSANIAANEVLDLRDQSDLIQFNILRNVIYRTHDQFFKTAGRNSPKHDQILTNLAIKRLKLDAVIGNLYVKSTFQRSQGLHSRIPNVTVLCVMDSGSIDLASIEEYKTGDIA